MYQTKFTVFRTHQHRIGKQIVECIFIASHSGEKTIGDPQSIT